MKTNRIRGFEEFLIVLIIGILLITSVSDFIILYLTDPLPAVMALQIQIGKGAIIVDSMISTWQCFFTGLLCGFIFSRRALLYAAVSSIPTAILLAYDLPLLHSASNLLFIFGLSYVGGKVGLNINHPYRIPASHIQDNTSFYMLAARVITSLCVAILSFAVLALIHNILVNHNLPNTMTVLAPYSLILAIVSFIRFTIRNRTMAYDNPNKAPQPTPKNGAAEFRR